jgi:hypothetical protein
LVRQTTKVIIFEILGMLSLLLMAAVGFFAFMLANGPVDLSYFKDDVEAAMAKARNGRAVSIESLSLQWSPSDRRVFVVASNLSLKDNAGEEAAFAETADLTLDAGSAFLGELEVIRARLEDGYINVQNLGQNFWSVAGDPLPEIRTAALPQSVSELLDRVNQVLGDSLTGLEGLHTTQSLEGISFTNMIVRVIATDGGDIANIADASGGLVRSDTDIALKLAGRGGGVGLPGDFSISIESAQAYNALRADVSVSAWPISALTGRFGLDAYTSGDLVADLNIGAGVTKSGGLERIDVKINRTSGALEVMERETIDNLAVDLTYIVEDDRVTINALDVQAEQLQAAFTGELTNVLAQNSLRELKLQSDQVVTNPLGLFPQDLQLGNVLLAGQVSDDFSVIDFETFEADIYDARLKAAGVFDLTVDHVDGQIPLQLDVTAEVIGDVSREQLLTIWPQRLGAGARKFAIERILNARLTEANATFNLKPDSFAQGHLRDEDLSVSFGFAEGGVRFADDLPPVLNAFGIGRLSGNAFSVSVQRATYGDWDVQSGSVELPVMNPRGGDMTIRAQASGPVLSALQNVSNSQLQLEARTGFDPDRVSGRADASLVMIRPSLPFVPPQDIKFDVKGTVRNGGLTNAVLDMNLQRSRIAVDITQDRMILSGAGDLEETPVQFTWRSDFGPEERPSDLSATAIVTPDVLNRFGLVGRAYLSGEIPTEMQGKVGAGGLQEATFAFDLREARIDLSEIGWIKRAGVDARATLAYLDDAAGQGYTLLVQNETAKFDGDVRLSDTGRLRTLNMRQLYIEDLIDVSGEISRPSPESLDLKLSGPYLDISPILDDLDSFGGGAEEGLPLAFSSSVELLKLRNGLSLSDAVLNVVSTKEGLQSAEATGITASKAAIRAGYQAGEAGNAPTFSVDTADAGYLIEAFLGFDYIRGGTMQLSGTLAAGDDPTKMLIKVENAQLVNAPFFTQILSLASLRGLADTLAGEGVAFSQIEVPMSIGGGRYVIDGARASGPALGLTVNGWIGQDNDGIELDGVLVPSFGVNSVLGGVPVIGDLFVGRKGEGIFSITYSVGGTLSKAQVAVNPLSAVTPGILRRIFENPSDVSIPKSIPVDPNLKPPSAQLPELPDDEFITPTPG